MTDMIDSKDLDEARARMAGDQARREQLVRSHDLKGCPYDEPGDCELCREKRI